MYHILIRKADDNCIVSQQRWISGWCRQLPRVGRRFVAFTDAGDKDIRVNGFDTITMNMGPCTVETSPVADIAVGKVAGKDLYQRWQIKTMNGKTFFLDVQLKLTTCQEMASV